MNIYLSPGNSLMSHIVGYLPLEDVARTRPASRFMKIATEEWSGGWRNYVHTHVQGVADCHVCRALVQTNGPLQTLHRSVEYCASCDNVVCVDHLCSIDGLICCGECF